MITRYAAWCRRQAGTLNCGHVLLPGVVLLGVVIWGLVVTVERYQLVIEHAALTLAGTLAGISITWAVLWLGETRQLRWLRTRCQDCRRARAVAEVTYANGLRSDTVRSCGDCWTRAEREAGAAAGWDVDTSGPGLPVITAGAPMEARVLSWEAAPVPGYLAPPPAPDNTAASAPLPPELAAYEPGIIPPSAWTRGHP